MSEIKKYPNLWHLRKVFIDREGNVFMKGKAIPELNGQFPTVVNEENDFIEKEQYDEITSQVLKKALEMGLTDEKGKEINKEFVPQGEQQSKKEFVTVPADVFDQIMGRLKSMEDAVASNVNGGGATIKIDKGKEEPEFGTFRTFNIERDDYLKKEIEFVTLAKGFCCSVYLKDGQEVLSPYKRTIYFQAGQTKYVNEDQNTRLIPFCRYATHSKKEAEFIMNSPFYETLIFSDYNKAAQVSLEDTYRIGEATNSIMQMPDDQIFGLANSYGIDIHKTTDKIKSDLIKIKINELVSKEKVEHEKTRQRLLETAQTS
jgi:hypothetical protein